MMIDPQVIATIDTLPRDALVTLLDDVGIPAVSCVSRSTLAGLVQDFYLDHHLSGATILAAAQGE